MVLHSLLALVGYICFHHLQHCGDISEHFQTLCTAYLAMISGSISRMLEGRALRFLGRPTRPGGKEMVSPCSNTLLALPMVALTPVLASPKPVLATFFTPSYTQRNQVATSFVL